MDGVGQSLIEIREKAKELRSFGFEPSARALEWAAKLVEQAELAGTDRIVPLSVAAEISGYNPGHIGRLVREGKIKDRRPPGTRGRLMIRVGDLPQKPGHTHTPDADVRDLASRLRKRG